MHKVVFNNSNSLLTMSEEAVKLFIERKGDQDLDPNRVKYLVGIPRHDETLISVVEELGDRVNFFDTDLNVVEILTDKYAIVDEGGCEKVATPEGLDLPEDEWIYF